MKERKQSFLEHLTGSRRLSDEELGNDEEQPVHGEVIQPENEDADADDEDDAEGIPGLAIDMYESDNEIIVQCMIAGVTPENLHISITRNTVTLEGRRNEPQGISEEQYISRELYWGQFFREIELPFEIDPDGADAVEKYGLLVIRLPRLDTTRIQELKVKSI